MLFKSVAPLGHKQLDAEHEQLLNLSTLCQIACPDAFTKHTCQDCPAMSKKECRNELDDIVRVMFPLIRSHFESEEALMNEINLAEKDDAYFKAHIQSHVRLVRQAEQLNEEFEADTPINDLVRHFKKLNVFITDQLLPHLHMQDTKLVQYMAAS